MALSVQPLNLEDFDAIISHATIYPIGDDLTAPPIPLCWPVNTVAEAHSRLTFTMSRQRQRFLHDPSVRFMKVVDTNDNDSNISVARWHYYPSGYSYQRDIHWELIPEDEQPVGLNVKLHNHILASRDAERAEWQGPLGSPCWILMHMVTRPSQRGRGAAGMLIQWGVEQAVKDGAPAYLEAGVMGKPIYERFGFRQVGELLDVDLERFGGAGMFVMAKMKVMGGRGGGGGGDGWLNDDMARRVMELS